MLFLAYTQWNTGMPWRSFALSKPMKMKTKQISNYGRDVNCPLAFNMKRMDDL